MATATASETIARVFKPIQQFTRGWMMAEATGEYGVQIGMRSGREFWIVGRAGVIGSATPEVAAGAIAFHAPQHVHEAWTHLPRDMTHWQVAEHYMSRITTWGDAELTRFDPGRLELIDTLGRRIADAAPASLGALFAGWRAMPQPESLGARVALTTHLLREMRGAAHLNAIIACGLTPLDAILASTNAPPRTGPGYAEQMGFTGPFRDPNEVRQARLEAEALTERCLEPYFGVLSPGELASFGESVEATRNAIDM
ncbi:helix-turn-helix domain-containing protein [Candidatus Poriferisodalis sp.]|uniref:helix-turn-helix domain-containing protein n=1 Tax=Candidatus Poriferisodalis sp. TaxID=3101277 RepID=UPI003B52E7FF